MIKKIFGGGRQNQNKDRRQPSEAEDVTEIEREYNYHLDQKKDMVPPFILSPDFGNNERNKSE